MTWETEVIVGKEQEFPEAMVAVRMATGERVRYVPERTCRPEPPTFEGLPIVNGMPHCSGCGMEWGVLPMRPCYCPNCGRKVEHD